LQVDLECMINFQV